MERFISACRNPLAKSATTKAIGHCDPSAECECKGTTNILGFANFFRKKVKKNLFNYVKNEDKLHELQNCT